MENEWLDYLVGKTVKEIVISENKDFIEFICDNERVAYAAEGKGCSNSWIDYVEDIDNLIGQKVVSIIEKARGRLYYSKAGENLIEVGIITSKGECTLAFKNATNRDCCCNNGYYLCYGGWLEMVQK